jgi:hypothetical protein
MQKMGAAESGDAGADDGESRTGGHEDDTVDWRDPPTNRPEVQPPLR